MKIISWNVNGLRAVARKKCFAEQLEEEVPDVICVQETKINQEIPFVYPGYQEFWSHGEKAGYAGTLTLVRENIKSERVEPPKFLNDEGRLVALDLGKFYLLNCYFPNGGMGEERLNYKKKYYDEFLIYVKELEKTKAVIFCGDVNTAHREIDLARPKANEKNTGFLPWERAWLDEVEKAEMVDCWRARHENEVGYTWWDYKTRARERNVGWRIDYFFCSKSIFEMVESCEILSHFLGSDHAPVELNLE